MSKYLIAQLIVSSALAYVVFGLGFCLAFLRFGVHRVDPNVAGAGIAPRLLWAPGVAALWPYLAWRWSRAVKTSEATR